MQRFQLKIQNLKTLLTPTAYILDKPHFKVSLHSDILRTYLQNDRTFVTETLVALASVHIEHQQKIRKYELSIVLKQLVVTSS